MTLQEKKEQLAHSNYPAPKDIRNVICGDLQALGRKAFISGFDEADPIGFMEWVWGKSFYFFDRTDDKWRNTTMSAEHTFTTEQVYLKFLEYKQTLKH